MNKPEHQSSTNKESYNLVAQNYATEHSQTLAWQIELDEFISLNQSSNKILDLGSGHGDETIYLASKLTNAKVIGVDFSEKMINIAQSKNSNVEFIIHDIVDYRPELKINAIWSRASFHHLNDEELNKLFQNIKNFSSLNFIIGMVNKYGNTEEIEVKQKYGTSLKRYFNYFDEEKVNKLAEKFGYEIVKQYKKSEGEHIFLVTFLKKLEAPK